MVEAVRRDVPGVVVGSSKTIRRHVHEALQGFMDVASTLALAALAIACLGVGNLVLANLAARQYEYGVLRAIGAERWLLGRLVLGESLLVALTGCAVGIALGLEASFIAREMHRRLLGLDYSIQVPWDVLAYGSLTVVGLALLASCARGCGG